MISPVRSPFRLIAWGLHLQIIGLDGKEATKAAFGRLAEMVKTTAQEIFAEGLHEYLERLLEGISLFHAALAEEFFQ